MSARDAWATITLNTGWDCTLEIAAPLRRGDVHLVRTETVTAGGKGVNVAKLLAANGLRVAAGGFVGTDDAVRFAEAVRAFGIEPRFTAVPGATRVNLMLRGANGEMKINRPGFPDLAHDAARLRGKLRRWSAGARFVVLSGSLPARFPTDVYARLIRGLREAGRTVILDAAGAALRRGVAARPALIKPNRLELEQLAGEPLPTDAAVVRTIRRLLERIETVIVSDGARGAWFATREILLRAHPPAIRAVDTTGAGDALLGQFCADYFPARRLTPEIAARALAAGAAACERSGTPPIPLDRVRALARRVKVVAVPPRPKFAEAEFAEERRD